MSVVAVAVACGEVEIAREFASRELARAWAAGFSEGADAHGGDACSVLLFPGDEAELEQHNDYVRREVARARAEAKPWSR